MIRRLAPLALTALAALCACTLNLTFDIDQPNVAVVTPAGGSATTQWSVDLSQYKEVTDHKNSIRSLDLDSADITVTKVNAANQATTMSGTLALRKAPTDPPDGDLKIADVQPMSVQEGSTTHIKGNAMVDAFLLQQFQNGGTFTVVMTGAVDKKADFVLDVVLHASVAYDSSVF
jgi:acetaldehyde dehydrogenase (acetylating)